MNNKILGIAVWGIGEHAQRNILPAVSECEHLRLIGITTRNTSTRTEVSEQWNCLAWENPDTMLKAQNVDVVYIATPVELHYEQCVKVLMSGKHLWCEKLLTSNLAQTKKLIKLSEVRELVLCEALMYQYHPQFELVKKLLKDKEIGVIKSITARFGFPHLDSENYRYDSSCGGGALMDAAVYPLSAALFLTNEYPEIVNSSIDEFDRYGVDDFGVALLKFPSKINYLAEWCFGCSYRNEILIWGEAGLITVERAFSKSPTFESKIIIQYSSGSVVEKKVIRSNHFVNMFEVFYKAVFSKDEMVRIRNISYDQARLINEIRK